MVTGRSGVAVTSTPLSRVVLGMRVDVTNRRDCSRTIIRWAAARESRIVCAASVNNVMQSRSDPMYRSAMNRADLVTPDGMPLVWALRGLGARSSEHVRGTDLTTTVLNGAADGGVPVGFFGGSPDVLATLLDAVSRRWPHLRIVYAWSPPFSAASPLEDARAVAAINASGARVLFVGLGCPKQELWMENHRERIQAVMLGVGAAFDFLAGTKSEAPSIMQRTGTEWLFRLATEPRRLSKRYFKQNPRFLLLLAMQLTSARMGRRRTASGEPMERREGGDPWNGERS
jgi:N-acetylglucosaminyldiphosphoundecaprenol N-acetyl-beta-D-mannosaminyltransferase